MAVVLGFDFGMKWIGLAVGQSITQTATPLKTLSAREGMPDWEQIAALIQEWQPQALVVGIPLNMDGSEQPITQAAKQFATSLETRFHLPVFGVDERLTSWEAKQRLKKQGKTQQAWIEEVNGLAAVLLLEDWLALRKAF